MRIALLALIATLSACTPDTPAAPAAGIDKSPRSRVLETGAMTLQGSGPVGRLDIHLIGFHPLKDDPQQQMEAHHYCRQVNEEFAQCALFDSDAADARLTGIEYLISGRLFGRLPADERRYWHPHNGEILSGQLSAPNLPLPAERALMRSKMNSYGKTWHLWHDGQELPLGDPKLAWSFNREGEIDPALVAARDRAGMISTDQRRRDRESLRTLARPQFGVDALREAFPQATPWPSVVDAESLQGPVD